MANLLKVAALTILWIVLTETLAPVFVVSGVVASLFTVYFSKKFLPFPEIGNVNFYKLVFYPFFLIGQVYKSGFYVIKIIFTGQKTYFVESKTSIKSSELRGLLAMSMTLTPGTIEVEERNGTITAAILCGKNDTDPNTLSDKDKSALMFGSLEKYIARAEGSR